MSSKLPDTHPQPGFPDSSFKYTPLQHVRVLFVRFVQGLFAQAPAGSYRWTEGDETEIVIRDENPINVESVGVRPAVNFTMGTVQFYSLGMDDLIDYKFDTGKKTKGILIPGTISINVNSRSDIEAHNIAWIISEHVWLLRELMLKAGFFELGRGHQITPPSPAGSVVANDSASEWYTSTVVCPFQFARKSSFTPLGKRIIQSIELALTTGKVPVGSDGPTYSGHEFPINEFVEFPPSFAPSVSDARGKTPDPAGIRQVVALPVQPHPLNPAVKVTLRSVNPYKQGIQPPRIGGHRLPIVDPSVKESDS